MILTFEIFGRARNEKTANKSINQVLFNQYLLCCDPYLKNQVLFNQYLLCCDPYLQFSHFINKIFSHFFFAEVKIIFFIFAFNESFKVLLHDLGVILW